MCVCVHIVSVCTNSVLLGKVYSSCSTVDLLWTVFFHVNFFWVKRRFPGCLLTALLLSSLRLRAPDPRQGQRVLRHVHHRQLRLCAASALEEPQETLWLLFQPGSATEVPLRQVRRALNVAPRVGRNCPGAAEVVSAAPGLSQRALKTRETAARVQIGRRVTPRGDGPTNYPALVNQLWDFLFIS